MKVVRELLLLSLIAFACSEKTIKPSYEVPVRLIFNYLPDGALARVPLETFKSYEKKWTRILNPRVSDETTTNLNKFFHHMMVANDNHHRAYESIVSMCASSQTTLKYFLESYQGYVESGSPKKFNNPIGKDAYVNIINQFKESRSHLTEFLRDLKAANDIVKSIDPEKEIAYVKNVQKNKNYEEDKKIGWWGSIKDKILGGSHSDPVAILVPDENAPKVIDFFSRLEDMKKAVRWAIKYVTMCIRSMGEELKSSLPALAEIVTPSKYEAVQLINTCDEFNACVSKLCQTGNLITA